MRKLFINSIRTEDPGDFVLWAKAENGEKPVVTNIGNYIEAVIHRNLGVTGTLKTPGGPQDIRSYELVIHHSAIHSDVPEMVHFDCPAKTVDTLLIVASDTLLKLRPVQVVQTMRDKQWKWFILAVNGVYDWKKKLRRVPTSRYEYLYGNGQDG